MRNKDDWKTKKQKPNLYKDTRDARYPASMEPHEDPHSSENIEEVERRFDELDKRLFDKNEAAAHEESEILERKHTMTTTATTHEESEILERQHTTTAAAATNDEAEIVEQHHAPRATAMRRRQHSQTERHEQHTAVTAAQAQVKDISKKVKQ